jgi:hypothetical protein
MIDMTFYSQRFKIDGEYLVTGINKKMWRYVDFTFALGYVIGAYLSVGTVNISEYKNSRRGMVFWYVPQSLKLNIERLKEKLKLSFNLDLVIREQVSSSTLQVVCYSKPLAEFFSFLGKKSGRKSLPSELFNPTSRDYMKGILAGIEDFEGHLPDTRNVLNKRFLNIAVIELYNSLKNY